MIEQTNGPGAAYEIYEMSEELADKLKLLDYEKELIGKNGVKIVPRYLAFQDNHLLSDISSDTTLPIQQMSESSFSCLQRSAPI